MQITHELQKFNSRASPRDARLFRDVLQSISSPSVRIAHAHASAADTLARWVKPGFASVHE
jgi:hypothetical protein